jgi:hypothetical protein
MLGSAFSPGHFGLPDSITSSSNESNKAQAFITVPSFLTANENRYDSHRGLKCFASELWKVLVSCNEFFGSTLAGCI